MGRAGGAAGSPGWAAGMVPARDAPPHRPGPLRDALAARPVYGGLSRRLRMPRECAPAQAERKHGPAYAVGFYSADA
jgi:hypothetical protein